MLEISWDGRCVHTGDGASIESQSQAEADLNKLILTILRTEKTKNVYVWPSKGIWISLDGVSKTRIDEYVALDRNTSGTWVTLKLCYPMMTGR
jgi:hypothetical protein